MNLRDIYPGELWEVVIDSADIPDFSAVPVTLTLEPPSGTGRIILRHLNGGTDGVLESANSAVRFTKPPTWTAVNFVAGDWSVIISTGTHATNQIVMGTAVQKVLVLRNGALPVAGV